MRRLLVFLGLAAAGLSLLVALAGGVWGPRSNRPEPALGAVGPKEGSATLDISPQIPGTQITGGRVCEFTGSTVPEAWTDPATGTEVRLPGLRLWWFDADGFEPITDESGTTGGRFRNVRLRTYREPKTLEEARAAATGDDAAEEALVKLRVTADEARSEALESKMVASAKRRGDLPGEFPIRLLGKVRVEDVEQGLVIEGSDMTVDPKRGTATGEGEIEVRHAAYVIRGRGLSLRRDKEHDRDVMEILHDAWIRLAGGMRGAEGMPLDMSQGERCPCEVAGSSGATVVRETRGTTDHLRIEVGGRVRADQEGGRHLEADRLTFLASRPLAPHGGATDAHEEGWRMDRLEADGDVDVRFPAERKDASTVLVALRGRNLACDAVDGRVQVVVVRGHPTAWMDGDLPLDGIETPEDAAQKGRLHLSCRDELWVRPAPAADVPAGADPTAYHRLEMRGGSRVEREGTGATPVRDVLEGETITMLVVTRTTPSPVRGAEPKQETLGVSFAAEGNVRLGGTRLSGTADRLVVTGLDGETPRLVADGKSTSFGLTGLGAGQGLLGTDGTAPAAQTRDGAGAPNAKPRDAWIVGRLQARGGVDAVTSLGGPALGVAAHLQGDAASYDRTIDRARLSRGAAGPARLATLADDGSEQDVLEASYVDLERSHGRAHAGGGVTGRVVSLGTSPSGGDFASHAGGTRGRAASMRVVVDGRIESTFRRQGTGLVAEEGAEQSIRVEGPLQVEVQGEDGPVDRLRADYLEVVLVRETVKQPSPPTVPLARARSASAPTGRATSRPAPTTKPSTWDVRAAELDVGLEGDRVVTMEASGEATVDGADGVVRGDVLTYDARAKRMTARGRGAGRADATFGPERSRNRLASPEIALTWGESGVSEMRARGPASALLYREEAKSPGHLERYTVASTGDLVVVPTSVTTVGWAEIHHETRPGLDAAWGSPWTLWSESVRIEGSDLLARESANVRRFVAEGPKTTFVTAAGGPLETSVWGDRFEIDVAAETATITGATGRPVTFRRGNEPGKRIDSDQERIVLSTRTGDLIRVDGPRLVMPRENR